MNTIALLDNLDKPVPVRVLESGCCNSRVCGCPGESG